MSTENTTTDQHLSDRHLRTLRELGGAKALAASPREACEAAALVLADNLADVPFALFLFGAGASFARVGRPSLAARLQGCGLGFGRLGKDHPRLSDQAGRLMSFWLSCGSGGLAAEATRAVLPRPRAGDKPHKSFQGRDAALQWLHLLRHLGMVGRELVGTVRHVEVLLIPAWLT
jgi:hypothetical protein